MTVCLGCGRGDGTPASKGESSQLSLRTAVATTPQSVGAQPPRTVQIAPSIEGACQPQPATDRDGRIYVAFGAGTTVYVARSTDGAGVFDAPVAVGELGKLALGRRRGPRIAVTDDAVVVTAISHDSGNLACWRSTDHGQTWSGPGQINDLESSAREGLHAMTAGSEGQLYCTWLDLRSGSTEIFGARSDDGGQTWPTNVRVYRSPSGTVCECCHPSVAFGPDDELHVMFRNSLDGCRDMYLATSSDGGQTFPQVRKLGRGRWQLDACPMDGGAVAVDADGAVITVWRRQNQIFRTIGKQSEQLLDEGDQPWIATANDGVWYAWQSRSGGQLWLQSPGQSAPHVVAEDASHVAMATSRRGESPLVLTWENGHGPTATIIASIVATGP
ncbi:MAG: sialidase family protein [Pirellulales bacterium]